MTRKEGFRYLLACLLYAKGHAALAYWIVPAKWKGPRTLSDVLYRLVLRKNAARMQAMFEQSQEVAQLISTGPVASCRYLFRLPFQVAS